MALPAIGSVSPLEESNCVIVAAPGLYGAVTMSNEAAEKPCVFVSYSHQDGEIVQSEVDWLCTEGLRVERDEDLDRERRWDEEVSGKILDAAGLLFYVSERSLDSPYCETEYDFAWRQRLPIILSYLEEVDLSSLWRFRFAHIDQIASRQVLYRNRGSRLDYLARLRSRVQSLITPQAHDPGDLGTDPAIAVLRFNFSDTIRDSQKEEFIADMVAMGVYNQLVDQPRIRVIPRNSSFAARSAELSEEDFGRTLGARKILAGEVLDIGGESKIRARLVDVVTGDTVFAEEFSIGIEASTQIVGCVLQHYAPWVDLGHSRRPRIGTHEERAASEYAAGLIKWSRQDINHLREAIKHFERAVQIDATYAEAHLAKAQAYIASHSMGTETDAALERATEAIDAARPLARDRMRYELDLCSAYCERIRHWTTGLRAEERIVRGLIESDPSDYGAYAEYSEGILMHSGFYNEAIRYLEVGESHDPNTLQWKHALALLYAGVGDLHRAREKLTQALDLDPENGLSLAYRSAVAARLGTLDPAREDLQEAMRIAGDNSMLHTILAMQRVVCIDYRQTPDAARERLMAALSANLPGPECQVPFLCGLAWLSMEDFDRGFEYWNCANGLHDRLLHHARSHLTFYCEPDVAFKVAADPRYEELMDSISMGRAWARSLKALIEPLTPVTGITTGEPYYP